MSSQQEELNYRYLLRSKVKEDLQHIAKNLKERSITKYNKKQLIKLILKNPEYNMKSNDEIEDEERNKKLKYYNELPERLYSKTIEKFNKNFEKPCLEFTGLKENGQGKIYIYSKLELAHKVSYALSKQIFVEDIPNTNEKGEKVKVYHGKGCDKSCIEPTHLVLKPKEHTSRRDRIRDTHNNIRREAFDPETVAILASVLPGIYN